MSRRAVYTGSFDPITLGHLNVIERSSRLVDELIVGVGTNIEKESLFTADGASGAHSPCDRSAGKRRWCESSRGSPCVLSASAMPE